MPRVAVFGYDVAPKVVPFGSGAVTLLLAVNNNSGAFLDCPQIVFTLPAALTADPGSVIPSSLDPGWSFSSGNAVNEFVASPLAPAVGLQNGASFGVELRGIKVAEKVSLAEIGIDETTAKGLGTKSLGVMITAPGVAITEFSVDTLMPAPDKPVTLSWTTTAASDVVLSYSGNKHSVDPAGKSDPILLKHTTPFTLTATGDGQPAEETITVTVAQVAMTSISADPRTVPQGGKTTLAWTANFADAFTIDPGDIRLPASATKHTVTVPEQDSAEVLFTVTALGPAGTNDSRPQLISLEPVKIDSFTASRTLVPSGESATLSWTTTSATSCVIDPEPDFPVGKNGKGAVTPLGPTTYRLGATGNGHAYKTVRIGVGPSLTTFGVTFDPAQPTVATVEWVSTGGLTAEIHDEGGGGTWSAAERLNESVGTSGSYPVALPAPGGWNAYDLVIADAKGAKVKAEFILAPFTNDRHQSVLSFQIGCPTGLNAPAGQATLSWTAATLGDSMAISVDDQHGNAQAWNAEPEQGSRSYAFTRDSWTARCSMNRAPELGLAVIFNPVR